MNARVGQGRFTARAVEAEFGTSKNKGTPFVRVIYEITVGELAGERVAYDGYFTEKTTARTLDSLRFSGCTFPGHHVDDLAGLGDCDVEIQVEVQTYEDQDTWERKEYPRVAWVNQLGGGMRLGEDMRMNDAALAQFRNRLKGAVVAAMQGKPGAAPRPNAAQTPTSGRGTPNGYGADDDIPF